MFRRVLLFVMTNVAVLFLLAIVVRLFGLDRFTTEAGINYVVLMVFAAILGFGGAFISLLISRMVAKWSMRVKVIDPRSAMGPEERWLLETTHALCHRAGLKVMPEVGIYPSDEVNAFATGPTKARSLIAVSAGLLSGMSRDEVEGVVAHEVAHIQNGDMVTMTLLQGVINTFVIFLSRVAAFFVSRLVREEIGTLVYYAVAIGLQICLSILGMLIVMAYSRHREYRADAGAAELAGRDKMIAALHRLRSNVDRVDTSQQSLATMKISGGRGVFALFSSHPPLEERIRRLGSV
jgi:heat shock protein HtpX